MSGELAAAALAAALALVVGGLAEVLALSIFLACQVGLHHLARRCSCRR